MESKRRRRRPAVSCILCRRRKIRCNRETPCSNCTKSKNAVCVYKDGHPGQTRRQGTLDETATDHKTSATEASPLTPSTDFSCGAASQRDPSRHPTAAPADTAEPTVDSRSFGNHVRPTKSPTAPDLAVPSSSSSAPTPISTLCRNSRIETTTRNISGNFHFHAEHRVASQSQAVIRSVTHKTRLFGQSHWVNAVGLLQDMIDIVEDHLRDDTSKTFRVEKQCKSLGRIIKSRRTPPWPCPPTPELPARPVADALIECYLDTSESILRVLHIPSFRRDYEAVWDTSRTPDPAFLVQLKLVLAIGAQTYDSAFSLRPYAMKWVYEAQTWLSAPEFKSRLGIPFLQTHILILLAREASGVGEDMVWAHVGHTLRVAMYMGFHRDPAGLGPRTTTLLVAEMRRRLWNTILELVLHFSLTAGAPPRISLEEFDTEPPGNFNDDQLTGQEDGVPIPKPSDQFTQTTMAVALRSMYHQRLAIVKYLNDLSSRGPYTETLKLDTELREAYKTLTRTLQACRTPSQGPSDLTLRAIDILLRRYLIGLHLPFFTPALQEAEFAFSRRVVVESALRIWRTAFRHPPSMPADETADDDPFARIAISGSNFRTLAVQSFVVINLELKTLLREEESLGLGPVELRSDLLLVIQDYKAWAWKSMEMGETNTKGYLMGCMADALVEALRRGMAEDEVVASAVKAAEEAEERCLVLLGEKELRGRPPQEGTPMGSAADGVVGGLDMTPEFGMEDWDYMASDVLFASAGEDPLSWVFQ